MVLSGLLGIDGSNRMGGGVKCMTAVSAEGGNISISRRKLPYACFMEYVIGEKKS